MRIVDRCCAGRRDIFQRLDFSAFLDVVCEVSSGTILHDQVYVSFRTLDVQSISDCHKTDARLVRLTTMSMSFVMCRCDSCCIIRISLCKLSNNLGFNMLLLTVLIAT